MSVDHGREGGIVEAKGSVDENLDLDQRQEQRLGCATIFGDVLRKMTISTPSAPLWHSWAPVTPPEYGSDTGLPQELVDRIIDYLVHDPDALKKCALISRDFLRSCRVRIFRRITLDHLLRRVGNVEAHEILSKAPHVIRYIQKLRLGGYNGGSWRMVNPNIFRALDVILGKSGRSGPPSLRKVSLRGFRWQDTSPETQGALERLLSCESLVHISLRDIHCPETVFGLFPPGLKSLKLGNVHIHMYPDAKQKPAESSVNTKAKNHLESFIFRSLTFGSDSVRAIDKFFATRTEWAFDITRLTTLGFYFEDSRERKVLQTLTQDASMSLEHLCIGFESYLQFERIDFERFPKLQSICVYVTHMIYLNNFANVVTWIVESFERLTSRTGIRWLGIQSDASLEEVGDRLQCDDSLWRRMDRTLTNNHIVYRSFLVKFRVRGCREDCDGFVNHLQSKLPMLFHADMVRVEFGPASNGRCEASDRLWNMNVIYWPSPF